MDHGLAIHFGAAEVEDGRAVVLLIADATDAHRFNLTRKDARELGFALRDAADRAIAAHQRATGALPPTGASTPSSKPPTTSATFR